MKIVIVGERLNRATPYRRQSELTPARWLRASLRLGALHAGLLRAKLRLVLPEGTLERCRTLNLCPPAPQGSPWDAALAARVGTRLLAAMQLPLDRGEVVADGALIACGRRVQAALGGTDPRWGSAETRGACRLITIPHPSGLCREWNDDARVEYVRLAVRSSLRGAARCFVCGSPCDQEAGQCHAERCMGERRVVCVYCCEVHDSNHELRIAR